MNSPSFRLGDFELTVFSDGTYFLDGGAFFGIIPKILWQKKVQADEQNRVATGLNSVLVRTGKQNVLIETGIGNKLGDKMKRIYEPQAKLLDNLKAGGVSPEEIDIVINSHLHFDHCGWNTVRHDGRVVPTFPKATYYTQRGEWEAAREQRERDAISYISENYDPLIESGQMRLLEGDAEIMPGISARIYSGHTRWMQAIMIESRGQTACYISDLIPTTAHLDLTWGMAFDLYPLETIENKRRFYAEAIPSKWLVLFTHDVSTSWGYIEELPGKRYAVRPVGD
jgi:glyoxylase-like metal-dependent hydrolase (beta-lactamase superfamily II)